MVFSEMIMLLWLFMFGGIGSLCLLVLLSS